MLAISCPTAGPVSITIMVTVPNAVAVAVAISDTVMMTVAFDETMSVAVAIVVAALILMAARMRRRAVLFLQHLVMGGRWRRRQLATLFAMMVLVGQGHTRSADGSDSQADNNQARFQNLLHE
ncbi:MAG TPA: hypothetical protein VKA19_15710 [Alphaproteobacteria bacterium]|nr:hypothetical protein [Alphaproteobacteria bacterium]